MAGSTWGMWAQVMAANDNKAISDATFSCAYQNTGGGVYYLAIAPNTDFWCKAPNYNTFYGNSNSYGGCQVKLSYTGGWPQTY
jgi:hypothetical protein